MQDDLLRLGLQGLANTATCYPSMWFQGHKGAAVLSAHFFCSSLPVSDPVRNAVRAFAQQIVQDDPELFAIQSASAASKQPILDKLREVIPTLSADGHDIIFACLALQALSEQPALASEAIATGIVQLLDDAQHDDPKRYLGYDNYFNEVVEDNAVPHFSDVHEAAAYALTLHDQVFPDQLIGGHAYYLAGNKLHDITHAHALVELDALGFGDVAQLGIEPLRKQFYLCATSQVPAGVNPFRSPTPLDPLTLSFWQRAKTDAHQVKLAYSVLRLLSNKPKEQRQRALASISSYWHLLP